MCKKGSNGLWFALPRAQKASKSYQTSCPNCKRLLYLFKRVKSSANCQMVGAQIPSKPKVWWSRIRRSQWTASSLMESRVASTGRKGTRRTETRQKSRRHRFCLTSFLWRWLFRKKQPISHNSITIAPGVWSYPWATCHIKKSQSTPPKERSLPLIWSSKSG